MMHRRTFLAAAAALAAAPRFTWAQEMRRLAIAEHRDPVSAMYKGASVEYGALIEGLEEQGWIEGRNLAIERYSAEGRVELYQPIAQAVVSSKPEVIFTRGTMIRPIMTATDTIPVVSAMGQGPIARYAESIARPGGNLTGLALNAGSGLLAKQLQLLHDAVPTMTRAAWLLPRFMWDERGERAPVQAVVEAAVTFGIELVPVTWDDPVNEDSFRRAFASLADDPVDGVLVQASGVSDEFKRTIVRLANDVRLPTISGRREFVEFGALMYYGRDLSDLYRRAGGYIDKILNGADPAETPIEQPTRYDFVINLNTASEIGLTFPTKTLIAATDVIN